MASLANFGSAAMGAGSALLRGASTSTLGVRTEIARRAALAREASPEGVKAPHWKLLLGELGPIPRAVLPAYSADRPQPVMLLPGFAAHPNRMKRMQRALESAGHRVHPWGLGFNLGPTPENFAFLLGRVRALSKLERAPVALVGWSLGGLFAREIACRSPEAVSKVITMGTPFSGDRHANNAWRAYQLVTGHPVHAPPVECAQDKPPVPTIALWSPRDGVVAPRCACGRPSERDRAVALRCTHLGFASDPRVIAEVLRQLDVDESLQSGHLQP